MTLNEFLEVKEDYVERALSLADMWPSDPVELKPELKYMENLDEIVERTRHLREKEPGVILRRGDTYHLETYYTFKNIRAVD